MANVTTFTRVYSKSSAGQLVSAKGPGGILILSHKELLDEFRKHDNKQNREATALVSVSNRIVDTVKRAYEKHYMDGELAEDIWIAFIRLQAEEHTTLVRVHAAENLFRGGLERRLSSTAELRHRIAEDLLPAGQLYYPFDVGVFLGAFARYFGARAPLDWIPRRLFHDCVSSGEFDDMSGDVDDATGTVLNEWWLTDDDFTMKYEEYKNLRKIIDDNMAWDLVDFEETWHDVDDDDALGSVLKEISWNKLLVKHERAEAELELDAVRIGL